MVFGKITKYNERMISRTSSVIVQPYLHVGRVGGIQNTVPDRGRHGVHLSDPCLEGILTHVTC